MINRDRVPTGKEGGKYIQKKEEKGRGTNNTKLNKASTNFMHTNILKKVKATWADNTPYKNHRQINILS